MGADYAYTMGHKAPQCTLTRHTALARVKGLSRGSCACTFFYRSEPASGRLPGRGGLFERKCHAA
jgi:hypothetical protein